MAYTCKTHALRTSWILACRAGNLDYFVDLLLEKSLIALNLKAVSLISMGNGLPIVRLAGGADGTRTRDPLRDRQVF